MDTEMIKVVQEAIQKGFTAASFVWFVGSIIAGMVGAYFGAFLKRRGELDAVTNRFRQSLEELNVQTREIEKIKTSFAGDLEGLKSEIRQFERVEQSELEYRKLQLAEFYGPIYAYVKLNAEIYSIWLMGKLQDIDRDILGLFRRNNEEMMRILATKIHLVEGSTIPDHFVHFATSVAIWNIYTAREVEHWVPKAVEELPQVKYPKDFNRYIIETTESLKDRLNELYEKNVLERKVNKHVLDGD
jgi:hypothetical protein